MATTTTSGLLAEVRDWASNNGWRDTNLGWVNPDETVRVREAERGTGVDIWRKTSAGNWQMFPTFMPADSVRQAVDLLAAYGILPPVFSSLYQAGRNATAFIANVETNPDRRCRNCGATTGLVMLHGNPLVIARTEWECAAGCADAQSGR